MPDNLSSTVPALPFVVGVYGSLRLGERANKMMEKLPHKGKSAIKGRLYKVGWYPGVKLPKKEGDNHTVVVDLYEIPDTEKGRKTLRGLDFYEGFDPSAPEDSNLFKRVQTKTVDDVPIVIYEYCRPITADSCVEDGDWSKRDDN